MKQSLRRWDRRRRDRRSIEWRLWRDKLCLFLCDYYCSMPLQLLERKRTLKRKYGLNVVSSRCCLFSPLIHVRECLPAIMTSALDVQHVPLAVTAHGDAMQDRKETLVSEPCKVTPRTDAGPKTRWFGPLSRPPLPSLIFLFTRLFVFLSPCTLAHAVSNRLVDSQKRRCI